jgi:hypothetical protein
MKQLDKSETSLGIDQKGSYFKKQYNLQKGPPAYFEVAIKGLYDRAIGTLEGKPIIQPKISNKNQNMADYAAPAFSSSHQWPLLLLHKYPLGNPAWKCWTSSLLAPQHWSLYHP